MRDDMGDNNEQSLDTKPEWGVTDLAEYDVVVAQKTQEFGAWEL